MGIYNQGLTIRLKHLPFPHFMYDIFCLSASVCLSVSASVSLSVCVSVSASLCLSIRLKHLPLPHFIYNNFCLPRCARLSLSLSLCLSPMSLSYVSLCVSLSLSVCLPLSVSLSLNVPSTYPSAKMTLRHPDRKTKRYWNQHIWMEPTADAALGLDTLQDVDNKNSPASQSVRHTHQQAMPTSGNPSQYVT